MAQNTRDTRVTRNTSDGSDTGGAMWVGVRAPDPCRRGTGRSDTDQPGVEQFGGRRVAGATGAW
ncbi:hypothetical protein [Natronomonas sp. EA1]|uniref:hypothetical protein n=1 Tax=Natronomonas sp. EA1 TaxID=3421655 RepID=UPI003EBF8E9A